MTEVQYDFFPCECGQGQIKLKKRIISRMGTRNLAENYISIAPCPFCRSTIDNHGRNLSKLV